MATKAKKPTASRTKTKAAPAAASNIDAFLAALDHPLKADIEWVRKIVLAASPAVSDGVKWNSLSFRKSDWFATVHLRSRGTVRLVLHTGAKAKDNPEIKIPDKSGLIRWLTKDRCLLTLGKGAALRANQAAFEAVLKAWLGYV